mgnify:CR=1 FL=1
MAKVSIVVPSYNHERYLPHRLDSILGQTVQDFDITIVDDASSDRSLEVLLRYQEDPRIRLIVNPVNVGNPFKNWNAGARAATGEFLWIAESDDFADPQFLETLIAKLESDPALGLAYCRSYMVDERDEILGTDDMLNRRFFAGDWEKDYQASGKEEIANHLVFRNTIPNASAVVMRHEIFARIGFAAEEFALAGDWHTWVRMLQVSDISYCAEPLNYFRCHDSSIRKKMFGKIDEVKESCQVFQYIKSTMDLGNQKIEEIQSFIIERWWNTLRNHPKELLSRKNISIYRLASCQNPRFPLKISKAILSKAKNLVRSPAK